MPLVKPNFDKQSLAAGQLTPGRYVLKVTEVKESEHLDKNGNNALVVKFETVFCENSHMNGKKVSRWFGLGGPGSKILYYFMRCLNPSYSGEPFESTSLLGKLIEGDVTLETNPKDGKMWARIDKMFPYLPKNSVSATQLTHALETDVPDFDDFDTN
jgi:hypothetical protein